MAGLEFARFDAITFDCYGTLIDWEQGILNALQPVLAPHGVDASEDELLERYARHEAALEAGSYLPYRDVLTGSLRGLCAELGLDPVGRRGPSVCARDRRLAGLSRHGRRASPPGRAIPARRDHQLRS